VSMPSMRVGTLTPEIMEQIRRVRKTGFTLAPEAGTDRLRRVINKGITEEDLLSASKSAFELGWKLLKFYFMFGLPTETDEDLAAIPALVGRAFAAVSGMPGRKINVSVATFVPKPHTPFQRARQLGIDEGFALVDYLKRTLRGKHFQLKWHDPRQSYLEGAMSRGDRRLSQVIEKAWQLGARLDAWSDYFRLETWRAAATDCGIDLDDYLRERGRQEILPWEHLDCGVDAEFIEAEAERALAEIYTPDCRYHGCQKCGLCDFKTVRPRVCPRDESVVPATSESAAEALPGDHGQSPRYHYRLTYSRTGATRFLGHLEVLQVFFRVLRRVELPVCYSQGFNPTPKVTFSPALPLGTESLAEYLIVEVTSPLADPEEIRAEFNRQLPAGFVVQGIALDTGRVELRLLTSYLVEVPVPVAPETLAAFLAAENYEVRVMRKGRERLVAARELVRELRLDASGKLELQLVSAPSQAVLKPTELVRAILGLSEAQAIALRVTKMWWREEVDAQE